MNIKEEKTMTTNELDDLAVQTFLDHQDQLFPEPVAETFEDAQIFLEDCFAVVCDGIDDVMDYLEESMDIDGMSEEEIVDCPEVFSLEDGRYLVVEG
jgi:hypothetical protein